MNLYASSLLVISVVCVTVGLQHLLIATRIEKRQVRLLFSVAAFAAAAERYGADVGELHVAKRIEDDAGLSMRLDGDWVPPWEK